MNAGDTILIPLPSASVDSHLWMIISDPLQSDDVLIVNFTSWRSDKDQACIVEPWEHAYLSKKSCVNFKDAKLCKASHLDDLLASGKLNQHAPLSVALLEKNPLGRRRFQDSNGLS